MDNRVGEIIEASTSEFTAQSYELYQLPAFGSLVKTKDEIYGIVYNAATAGIEPGRRPIARGKAARPPARLRISMFSGRGQGFQQVTLVLEHPE